MDKKPLIISVIVIVCIDLFLFSWRSLGASISAIDKITLVVSEIAILFSIHTFFRIQKTNTMPVLVFVHRFQKTWQIQNVGNGPALNSLIGDRTQEGKWSSVLYGPIAAGASLDLDLSENKTEFRAVYYDIKGNTYTSQCIHNIHRFYETNKFPEWKADITERRVKEIYDEIKKFF